jgi:prevent-host-death family protein
MKRFTEVWEKRGNRGVVYMTICDYVMTMTQVGIAELKARLSEYLRSVRRGRSITVLDRDTPVARVVPYIEEQVLRVREPRGRVASLQQVALPPPLSIDLDVVELLLEERQGER